MKGDIHSISPQGWDGIASLWLKSERFHWEDVLKHANEINHWILAPASRWNRAAHKAASLKRSAVQTLWPRGGRADMLERSALVLLQLCRPADQKAKSAAQFSDVTTSMCWRYHSISVGVWEQRSSENASQHASPSCYPSYALEKRDKAQRETRQREGEVSNKLSQQEDYTNPH